MAIIKHIAIKNTNYTDAVSYLKFEHNEFTQRPILDANGNMIRRQNILIDGINCTPEAYGIECNMLNRQYGKNRSKREIKAHHYIISFDPRDYSDNDLTPEKAHSLGLEFARQHFPGHQMLVCTHEDGHNGAGNIHVHIVFNSLRKLDVEHQDFMERPIDALAGYKHHPTQAFLEHLKSDVMTLCQRENLYQVDLLSPAKVRVTDREYWARKRGQIDKNTKNGGICTRFETEHDILRRQIDDAMKDSYSMESFKSQMLSRYGVVVGESRGRINYLPSDRTKPIRGRQLGIAYEKESIEAYFCDKGNSLLAASQQNDGVTFIMQLRFVVEQQQKPYSEQDVRIRHLKNMAQTLAFCQENGIQHASELDSLLTEVHKKFVACKDAHSATTSELKKLREILKYAKQRHANKKVYLQFMKSTDKASFRSEHDSEIRLYEGASQELRNFLGIEKIPSEKELYAQISELSKRKNAEYDEMSELRRREKVLREHVKAVKEMTVSKHRRMSKNKSL